MQQPQQVSVFWFRRDLRLHDNAGLYHALISGRSVLPVFIFDKQILDQLIDKHDRRVHFINKALLVLQSALLNTGSSLIVKYGNPFQVWQDLLKEFSIGAVYTNHDFEPYARARDESIRLLLHENGIQFYSFKDQVIFEKQEVVKDDGSPYTVWTPYSKKWKEKLNSFYLRNYPDEKYFGNFFRLPPAGIPSLDQIGFGLSDEQFPPAIVTDEIILNYHHTRDFPGINGTSRLSVHLRFGTISIRDLIRRACSLNEKFLNELIWREFYQMILWHFPHVVEQSFRPEYDLIEWRNSTDEFEKWCKGETGFPIVDAGMRELNATGYMHNRVRMIVASFLTKDLLIDWRWGAAYFADKLLDYDLASNNGGWQWAAGTGVDAAPYFRIFNPTAQTEKFDPERHYIKKWVPELMTAAYPDPIVDHKLARERTLSAYRVALKR